MNWIHGGSMLLSLNRFERKKNVALALRALREVIDRHAMSSGACSQARLVVAGGHDPRVRENVEHLRELKRLAEDLDIEDRVVFMKNVSERQRCGIPACCMRTTVSAVSRVGGWNYENTVWGHLSRRNSLLGCSAEPGPCSLFMESNKLSRKQPNVQKCGQASGREAA